jgi:hypothetical protein
MRGFTVKQIMATTFVVALVGGLLAASPPAGATTAPVIVQATGACGTNRAFTVDDAGGTPLGSSNGLNASNGPAGFVTNVTDTSNCDVGFQVSATMSNLYQYTPGTTPTWTCANTIASSKVSFTQPTNPLSLNNISALIDTPTLALTGALSGLTILGTTLSNVTNALVPGSLTTSSTNPLISQTGLGLPAGELLNSLYAALPLQIQASSNTGVFTSPATAPAGCTGGGTTPTSLTVMSGASNTGLLTSGVTNYLDTITGTATGTAIPVTDLITDGILSQASVLGAVLPAALQAVISLLTPLEITNILSAITVTVSNTAPVLNTLTESGLYTSLSDIAVNTASATAGEYEGQLTLTLVNTV